MKESSNIGTAQIADQLGSTRQKEFLRKMGFLDKVEVELKERGRTLTPGSQLEPDRDDDRRLWPWHRRHAAPPRHRLCDACSTAASIAQRPCSRSTATIPPAKGHRVFSEETSYKMRALLRLVVTKGTGKKADAPGYRVGGKTGTASKMIGGHYVSRAR